MSTFKRAAVVAAGLIAFALAAPGAAVPAVQVVGPSSVIVGDPLNLRLDATGDPFPGLEALTVEIQGPPGVFDLVFGPLVAQYSPGGLLAGWDPSDLSFSSAGASATVLAFSLIPVDIPAGGGALLDLSFDVLAAPPQPVSLAFFVTFNNDVSETGYRVTINAVPEPGTFALLFAGLGLAGLFVRSRRAA
jgi:hypothetical protein